MAYAAGVMEENDNRTQSAIVIERDTQEGVLPRQAIMTKAVTWLGGLL
jgi:hypothetical protein